MTVAFRVIPCLDVTDGREVWRERLPAGGQATPSTYRGADGKTVRARLNSVAVTPLEPLLFNSEQSTVDRITAIQRIRPQGAP